MADILRYVPAKKESAKQEALGITESIQVIFLSFKKKIISEIITINKIWKKNYSYIPIIILLVSDAFYHTADIFWISGLGTSAIVSIGYIANFLYIIDKIGDGIGRSVNVLISNSFGAEVYENT